jgi:hypothetical protein
MSRLAPLALLLAALVVAVAPTPAGAAKKKTYCQKATKGLKVVDKDGPITAYTQRNLYGVCSDKLKRKTDISIKEPKQKVAQVYGTKSGKCAVVRLSNTPSLSFKDMKGNGANGYDVGTGAASASIGKVVLAANCVVAWVMTVDGTSTIRTQGILPGSPVTEQDVVSTTEAIPAASLKVTARGKGVTIAWTQAGQAKTVSLG